MVSDFRSTQIELLHLGFANPQMFASANRSPFIRSSLRSASYGSASQPNFANPETPAHLSRHSAATADHTLNL
jgi:hypothetical protein